jgi:hypothetical protein
VSWSTRVGLWLLSFVLFIVWGACALDRAEAQGLEERYSAASRGGVRPYQVDLIAAYFPPEQIDTAIAVMSCESRGEVGAVGLVGERGLFQIRPEFHQWRADRLFWRGASLFHPEVNIAVAADLWADAGWRPWSCAR